MSEPSNEFYSVRLEAVSQVKNVPHFYRVYQSSVSMPTKMLSELEVVLQQTPFGIPDFSPKVHQNIFFLGKIPTISMNDLTEKNQKSVSVLEKGFGACDLWINGGHWWHINTGK